MPTQESNKIPVACFAPPLTDEKMTKYKKLIDSQPDSEVKDSLTTLYSAVEKWWNLPESTNSKPKVWDFIDKDKKPLQAHETVLDKNIKDELFDLVPWMRELDTLSNAHGTGLFDQLRGPIRDCAFDLLWHCKELTLDREPMTTETLKGV